MKREDGRFHFLMDTHSYEQSSVNIVHPRFVYLVHGKLLAKKSKISDFSSENVAIKFSALRFLSFVRINLPKSSQTVFETISFALS